MTPKKINAIAQVCHEVMNGFDVGLGIDNVVPWASATDEVKDAVRADVRKASKGRGRRTGPEESGLSFDEDEGWKRGPDDPEQRKRGFMSVGEFNREEQLRDQLFQVTVLGLLSIAGNK
jgi:hypothetical protein